jgi:hypothetical protein
MTSPTFDSAAIRARADWLQRRLNLIPALYGPGAESSAEREQRAKRHHYEVALLMSAVQDLDPPGRFAARGPDGALDMMGIKTTSTQGVLGACRNWVAKARVA